MTEKCGISSNYSGVLFAMALLFLVCLPGALAHIDAQGATHTLWIDADPAGLVTLGMDLDDDLALAVLLRSTEVRVAGISSTYGNAPARQTAKNVATLLAGLGHDDIPVYVGAECALPWPKICDRSLAPDDGRSVASEALVMHLAHLPAFTVSILALGPLTNIAAAISDPRVAIARPPKAIFIVGGTLTPPHRYLFIYFTGSYDLILHNI